MLNNLIESGQMFGYAPNCELVSVQDLLAEKLGREVGYSEAVAYMYKARVKMFRSKVLNYKLTHKTA